MDDQKFKVILGQKGSLRLAWAIETLSEKEKYIINLSNISKY